MQGAAAPPARPGAPQITQISLERSAFGAAGGTLLVLRRDGSATLIRTGSERHGSADQTQRGRIEAAEFDALARLALAQGFFELQDIYQDPELQDGAWSTTRITRGPDDKQVFRRDDAGPPALRRIEAAIEALQSRIRFAP